MQTQAIESEGYFVSATTCVESFVDLLLSSKTQVECNEMIDKFLDQMDDEKSDLALLMTTENRELLKQLSSNSIKKLHSVSKFLNHASQKPHGYPGDFEVLEHIYDKRPFSTSRGIGVYIDNWAINGALSTALRERKELLVNCLESYVSNPDVTLLSIASGSAKELREFGTRLRCKVDLIDSDRKAFEFMISRAEDLDLNRVRFFEGNALANPSTWKVDSFHQYYDLVYNFGLYDYLSDRLVVRALKNAKQCVKQDGLLLFSLKDHRFHPGWFLDLFADYAFVERTVDSGYALAEKAGLSVAEVHTGENGVARVFCCKVAS